MPAPENAVAFLMELGADEIGHRAERSLLEHLLGTYALLERWGCREEVALAGLYHSIYGTSHFERTCLPPSERDRVRAVIGDEAERIAYLFSAMDRDLFLARLGEDKVPSRFGGGVLEASEDETQALCDILLANELDLATAKKGADRPDKIARKVGPCFGLISPYVSHSARAAYEAATG